MLLISLLNEKLRNKEMKREKASIRSIQLKNKSMRIVCKQSSTVSNNTQIKTNRKEVQTTAAVVLINHSKTYRNSLNLTKKKLQKLSFHSKTFNSLNLTKMKLQEASQVII
ncbi:hypothetical protein M758_UG233100 [Ceratodon purpureus]|nr:hypothetical protein M758_UG233100 [Ceratodon purpureus]